MYTCPKCHKQVKDLKSHLKRMHPGNEPKVDPVPEAAGKNLELVLKEKAESKLKDNEVAKGYHCVDCGAALSQGQTPCPNCGHSLDWSQL